METKPQKSSTENFVKEIRNKTRRIFTPEQKILIVMEAIRGESLVAEICRKYGIHQSQFYGWNKQFLEACKKTPGGGYNPRSYVGRCYGASQRESTS